MSDTDRTNPQPIRILLIEDDPGDALITTEALRHSKLLNDLQIIDDGEAALAYLRAMAESPERPHLVLLDLNLPKVSGLEILAAVKSDPSLRRIPIVVLTTSAADEDVLRSYDHHANAYVTKPVDFDRFVDVVRHLDEFYFTIVKLPPH